MYRRKRRFVHRFHKNLRCTQCWRSFSSDPRSTAILKCFITPFSHRRRFTLAMSNNWRLCSTEICHHTCSIPDQKVTNTVLRCTISHVLCNHDVFALHVLAFSSLWVSNYDITAQYGVRAPLRKCSASDCDWSIHCRKKRTVNTVLKKNRKKANEFKAFVN